ncbi:MAG: hypothetical protein AAB799_02095 [Patescibacteria group bacterium]
MNKQISNGVDSQIPLTKQERRELKQQEKFEARELFEQRRKFKKLASWGLGGGIAVAVIGGLIWYAATRPPIPESDIVSRTGFHWHPQLAIYVKGEKQEIPANIGIGAIHQPIHTHDDSGQGIVHMEFQSLVRKQDVTLGQFFKNWDKDMRSFGVNMKMTVNGEANTDYENYAMRDKDKIELRFE